MESIDLNQRNCALCVLMKKEGGLGSMVLDLMKQLTACRDHLSLTQCMLGMIESIPTVESARVFEVFNVDGGREVKDKSSEDLVVRELMNTLDEPRAFQDIAALTDFVNSNEPSLTKDNAFQQIVFPIRGSHGLNRALLILAKEVPPEYWQLICALTEIYSNLLGTIDENERDRLTGLLNRKTLDEKLNKVIDLSRDQALRSGRKGRNAWLAVVDIDHFKSINDNYGHLFGDEVLLLLARLMDRMFRATDLLFRYGGEEFVVVLLDDSIDGAIIALERFRKMVAESPFPNGVKISVSIGFSELKPELSLSSVINQADQALYYAKAQGRNRLVYFDDIIDEVMQ